MDNSPSHFVFSDPFVKYHFDQITLGGFDRKANRHMLQMMSGF